MSGVSVLVFVLVGTTLISNWAIAQFLNHRPFPTYSLEHMPETSFSCRAKILGGYYADPDTECQMFHICVKVAGVGVQDFRFLCPNGTAFDQDHQICAEWEDVDCDASTLYYSSDNFDLYRIGSGLETKAVKYGEDEETFSLQRAETGDARLNREHQSNSINQKKDQKNFYRAKPTNDKDIFKTSSSSNFFNNRNNGKERDEDYDDNININQDYEQKRKLGRNKTRRPVQNDEVQTRRPTRPTGFANNFAGSSYIPTTTSKPSSTTINNEQYTTALNHYRARNGQRRQQFTENTPTPSYTVSTPAPFRQTQQYNTPPNRQIQTTQSENYSKVKQTTANQEYNYEVTKTKPKTTVFDNYPSNNPQYNIEKKPTTPLKQTENYPTTLSTKPKPFSLSNFPTTFAPRTNAAYTQIAQQTVNYTSKTTNSASTPKSTSFTQYTPTVPKITSTTPVSRSNRFDETQYDDGAYNHKYDYDGDRRDDEFLKTAHSQNIAASRNEYAKTTRKQQQQQSTQKPNYDSPRPFSVTSNTPAVTEAAQKSTNNAPKTPHGKKQKTKDVSYDYAYYDTSVGSEPDYEVTADIQKSTVKN